MAGRLRLELNRTVRTTVAQAVDAVWVAYEDELTKMTAPLDERAKDYELFHVCCRRLVDFIAHNMETTPGFVEQMDRLILACHSGATKSTVHLVMTRDLRIRRCSKENHVDVKTEPSMTDDKESPVISPLNGTIDMALDNAEKTVN
ncbi:Alcohol dehydrogenase [Phytophthora megakarya]|uniref:Alcohol dehydrogenase n=1 Tax=Phytophthora megakarya TaxID=4795 RepID=A0A225X3F3_9STRA|nr:Alcohol dehydrogenase [Phytophthora megakarya]